MITIYNLRTANALKNFIASGKIRKFFSCILLFLCLGYGEVKAQYCTPSGGFSACAITNDFWITAVSFTGAGSTFNYTGGTCVSSAPYYLNTGYTGNVVAGNTYTLSVSRAGQTYKTYFNVWVDWDNNNVLNNTTPFIENIAANMLLNPGGGLTATASITIPAGVTPGVHRLRVRVQYNVTNANNPCLTTGQAESKDFNLNVVAGCTSPTTQATNFGFNGLTTTQATVNWTRGNGTGGVVVVAHAGSAVSADPVSGTDYTAGQNSVFGSGTNLGANNYVVYSGTGNSVTVTNLSGSINFFSVYEYNTASICYKVPGLSGVIVQPNTAPSFSCSYAYTGTTGYSTITIFQRRQHPARLMYW